MSKVKCLECGFEAPNIEPHVSQEHDLALYLSKHGAKVEDLIHSSVLKKAKKTKKKVVAVDGFKVGKNVLPFCDVEGENTPDETYYNFPKDTEFVITDINKRRNVLLTGHTGTGKTSLIFQLAARTKNSVHRVNLNGQITISEFIGFWTVKGGETVWVDGTLPHAMKTGQWLVLDEIDFAEPGILAVLNSVLEKNGKLLLKEKGHELVKPHENFRIFATANSVGAMSDYRGLYQGTNIMNEAFLDRWQVYHIGYLPEKEEMEVLKNLFDLNDKIAKYIVTVANMIREAFEREEVACTFSLRRMIDWTAKMKETKNHIRAAESTILNKIAPEDAEVIKGIIQRVMKGDNS